MMKGQFRIWLTMIDYVIYRNSDVEIKYFFREKYSIVALVGVATVRHQIHFIYRWCRAIAVLTGSKHWLKCPFAKQQIIILVSDHICIVVHIVWFRSLSLLFYNSVSCFHSVIWYSKFRDWHHALCQHLHLSLKTQIN